jgi:hypothetical protein
MFRKIFWDLKPKIVELINDFIKKTEILQF